MCSYSFPIDSVPVRNLPCPPRGSLIIINLLSLICSKGVYCGYFVHKIDIYIANEGIFSAKTEELRKRQENMAYKKIVQSVDPNQKYGKVNLVENFGAELKVGMVSHSECFILPAFIFNLGR